MKTKILASISGLLVSLITPLAILVPQVSAAVVTWDGEGADNNFSNAANWSGDTLPVNGDSITFDLSILTQTETLNNDLTINLAGINRNGTNASSYNYLIEGNPITLSGPLVGGAPTDSGELIINVDIVLASDITLSSTNRIRFGEYVTTAELNIGAYNLTLNINNSSLISINLVLTGSGNINLQSGSLSLYSTSNQFTGNLIVTGGAATIVSTAIGSTSDVVVSGAGSITLSSVGSMNEFEFNLTLGQASTSTIALQVVEGAISGSTARLVGGVTLSSDVTIQPLVDLIVDEPFDDNGFEIIPFAASPGSITLPTGEPIEAEEEITTIEENDKNSTSFSISGKQTFIVNGERGDVTVSNGGKLKGSGRVGNVDILQDGLLAPGQSPGCLTMNNLSITAGLYEVEIEGKTVCSQYDQAVVNGTVDINLGSALDVTLPSNFVPALNDEFIIINNDGTDAVTGEFDGLAPGDTFEVAGVTFEINYDGGDGNDVVLTATAVPAAVTAPDTGVGQVLQSPFTALLALMLSIGALVGIRKAHLAK